MNCRLEEQNGVFVGELLSEKGFTKVIVILENLIGENNKRR